MAPRNPRAVCFLQQSTNFPVNDIFRVSAASISDCCQICGANPLCNAVAFDKLANQCYLKSSAPVPGSPGQQIDPNVDFGTLTIR